MIIIVHSRIIDNSIRDSLGTVDYSYYFVRNAFIASLESFATIVASQHPETDVDPVYDAALESGETCVFLSFAPPHKTPLGLRCPTIPVFAWEFNTIPNEVWDNEPRNDWRHVFAACGRAISLSRHTAQTVRRSMGATFPIIAVPTPIFEKFSNLEQAARIALPTTVLTVPGPVFDTNAMSAYRLSPVWPPAPVPLLTPAPIDMTVTVAPKPQPELAPEPEPAPVVVAPPRPGLRRRLQITKFLMLQWYRLVVRDLLPRPAASANAAFARLTIALLRRGLARRRVELPIAVIAPVVTHVAVETPPPLPAPEPEPPAAVPYEIVRLDGVVYISMFSPTDGRKNWFDIVTAFCWAFRETADATLVLKIIQPDRGYEPTLQHLLKELSPFRCRVVVLHGFLETPDYRALIAGASYYVNASRGEGLCMPLMEFMSAGTPAIAPRHTAFEDYIDEKCAFVLRASIENNVWPEDSRDLFRTTRYRLDWSSLMQAYLESYRVARQEPERYAAMSEQAREAMRDYCGLDVVTEKLRDFLMTAADNQDLQRRASRSVVPVMELVG